MGVVHDYYALFHRFWKHLSLNFWDNLYDLFILVFADKNIHQYPIEPSSKFDYLIGNGNTKQTTLYLNQFYRSNGMVTQYFLQECELSYTKQLFSLLICNCELSCIVYSLFLYMILGERFFCREVMVVYLMGPLDAEVFVT